MRKWFFISINRQGNPEIVSNFGKEKDPKNKKLRENFWVDKPYLGEFVADYGGTVLAETPDEAISIIKKKKEHFDKRQERRRKNSEIDHKCIFL